MNTKITALLLMSFSFSSVLNADWNTEDNIRKAAREWSNIYCSLGIRGVEDYVRGCYESIQFDKEVFPQKLERCLALDFISSSVDTRVAESLESQASAYFESSEMRKRSGDALTQVGVPEGQQEMALNYIGGEAFKYVTPCQQTEVDLIANIDYSEIKSALLDANLSVGKTLFISGSFLSLGISDNIPHITISAITDTSLDMWDVRVLPLQRQLVENLRSGQKVSLVCRIIRISSFPMCELISMR